MAKKAPGPNESLCLLAVVNTRRGVELGHYEYGFGRKILVCPENANAIKNGASRKILEKPATGGPEVEIDVLKIVVGLATEANRAVELGVPVAGRDVISEGPIVIGAVSGPPPKPFPPEAYRRGTPLYRSVEQRVRELVENNSVDPKYKSAVEQAASEQHARKLKAYATHLKAYEDSFNWIKRRPAQVAAELETEAERLQNLAKIQREMADLAANLGPPSEDDRSRLECRNLLDVVALALAGAELKGVQRAAAVALFEKAKEAYARDDWANARENIADFYKSANPRQPVMAGDGVAIMAPVIAPSVSMQ